MSLSDIGHVARFCLRTIASLLSGCLISPVVLIALLYEVLATGFRSILRLKRFVPFVIQTPRYRKKEPSKHVRSSAAGQGEREPLLPTSRASQSCLVGCQRELESRLCDACNGMVDASALLVGTAYVFTQRIEMHNHHEMIEDLRQSSTNCALCQLLLRSVRKRKHCTGVGGTITPGYRVRIWRTAKRYGKFPLKIQVVSRELAVRSLVVSQTSKTDLRHVCDAEPSTNSPVVLKWAREQIDVCRRSHSRCRTPHQAKDNSNLNTQFLPRRLLDVGRGSDITVKLINTSQIVQDTPDYIALSYCWGGLAGVRLCKSNLSNFTEPSPVATWDKTYRDAIAITRMLGIQYLWIDALCIIQPEDGDDGAGLADWGQQAPEMGRIYAHATCVLSATAAKNTTEGCIFEKTTVGGGCHLRDDGVTSLDVNLAGSTGTIIADLFHEKVDNARLSTRGWAFQERVLAKRLLHFCDGVVLFECGEMQAASSHGMSQFYPHEEYAESQKGIVSRSWAMVGPAARAIFVPMPTWKKRSDYAWNLYRRTTGDFGSSLPSRYIDIGLDASDSRWRRSESRPQTRMESRATLLAAFNTLVLPGQHDTQSTLLFHHCWFLLVSEYSARDLTKPSDKVMAIAGLAQFLPYRFESGILFDCSHYKTLLTLMWARLPPEQEIDQGWDCPPRPKRNVPSWSWASINGHISHCLMQPSDDWSLEYEDIAYSIECPKDRPERLILTLRTPAFAFDKETVAFIPDIELEEQDTRSLQCVPLLYYQSSDKKIPQAIVHGIVVRDACAREVGDGNGTEGEEEDSVTLERVGYFWWLSSDLSWKPKADLDQSHLATLVIV